MSREKALKLINEYLAKQEPIKVELNLINKIEKADDVARASEKGLSKIAQRLETEARAAKNNYDFVADLCDKALPMAKELGDNDTVKFLNVRKSDAKANSKEMQSIISKVESMIL